MSAADGKGIVGAHGRTVWDDDLGHGRCTADAKNKLRDGAEPGSPEARCSNAPPKGATTCRFHGSRAPQVERARRLRLQELADPAIAQLARLLASAESETVKIRAVENVLDRTGYVRRTEIDVAEAKERLLERLLDRRDQGDDTDG